MQRFMLGAILISVTWIHVPVARAWIFHEHARIALQGMMTLSPADRALLGQLWQLTNDQPSQACSHPARLSLDEDDPKLCVGLATLPAIAADHSCSPQDMWESSSKQEWMLDVLGIAGEVEARLAKSKNPDTKIGIWNYSNLVLQRADANYATRAGANNGHFDRWRSQQEQTLSPYLRRVLKQGRPLDTTSLYSLYHLTALRFAAEAGRFPIEHPARKKWGALSLKAEMFALHFLEDSFSAGHFVGTWGGVALRKGTHDYYCAHGVPATTWSGFTYSAYGDAHMQPKDLERASAAVADSLRQVLLAYTQKTIAGVDVSDMPIKLAERLYAFDSCLQMDVPASVPPHIIAAVVEPIWMQTPQPAIGPPQAHLPRFRSEIGPFVSFQGGLRLGSSFGGYDSENSAPRPSGSLDGYLNVGYGVEGATGLRSDGVFLLGVGLHGDAQQYDSICTDCQDGRHIGDSVPRVPGRFALGFRARMPFWLIPGDLLLLAPVMSWAATKTYTQMAATAADGGLIPWQSVIITGIGDFQFVIGREIRVLLFGLTNGDVFLRYNPTTSDYSGVSFKSVQLDFPFVEYRPFRAFSENLTASAGVQLGFSYMWNYDEQLLETGAPAESLGDAWLIYLRLLFDARVYP